MQKNTEQNYITLKDFLKYENIINSGGEAKIFLFENIVLVNGKRELRRGRKIYPNDEITVDRQVFKYENCST